MRLNFKRTGGIVAVVGALLLALAMVAFSQGPRGGFHGGPGGPEGLGGPREFGPFGPLGRDLNLTDEQKAQVKKIFDSAAESAKPLHEQLRTLHESEPDPLSGAAFDEAAVRSAAEARAKIEVELQVIHARAMSQVYSLLTTEQKAKLAARRQEFEQRRSERRPPPPPPADAPGN